MSIKFSCPHCSKALNVKDSLAGRKAQCPGCKQVMRIPNPQGAPAGPDVEALAAAAFSEEEKNLADQPIEKIEFACPMCDEKIAINVALCGKQAPCPECRRIVKVPLLKKEDAKDWRKIDTRATAGIRLTEVKGLEGTWGTDSTAQVSRQALLEAKVIPTEKPRLGWQGWVKRSAIAAASVGVLAAAIMIVLRITNQNSQNKAFSQGMAYLDDKSSKLLPGHLALGHQLAGDYLLKSNKLDEARKQYDEARSQIRQADGATQAARDLAVISLAGDQIGLGGEKAEIDRKVRMKWEDASKELGRTVQLLLTPDGKRIAVRNLTRQLAARGQGKDGTALAGYFPEDRAELLAVVGLELLRAKMNTEAEAHATMATQALQPTAGPIAGKPAAAPAPPPPSLIALLYGLGQAIKARALAPEAGAPVEVKSTFQLGTVLGLGMEGKWPAALAVARDLSTTASRIKALTGLGEIAADAGQKDDAKSMVEEAAKLVEAEKGKDVPAWTLWRLASVAGKVGAVDAGQAVARAIPDDALRQQALIDLLPSTVAPDQLESTLGAAADKNSVVYAQALSEACRRQAAHGDAAALQKSIPSWEPEKLRPFAYLGLALGLQEHNQ